MNGRRLSPDELAKRLPALLSAHGKREDEIETRKAVAKHKIEAAQKKVADNLGEHFRSAYKGGVRFRATSGRFLALPKVG